MEKRVVVRLDNVMKIRMDVKMDAWEKHYSCLLLPVCLVS